MSPSMENRHVEALECKKCNKTFAQRSSLIRHSTLCSREKPLSVRQKSCHQCSAAKARCDLQRPRCSRCISRSTLCQYLGQSQHDTAKTSSTQKLPVQIFHEAANQNLQSVQVSQQNAQPISNVPVENRNPELSGLSPQDVEVCEAVFEAGLGCSADVPMTGSTAATRFDGLGDEWMLPLVPQSDPMETGPILATHSMRLLLRVFRTWPRMIVKQFQLPPIFHHTTIPSQKPLPQLLSNCFTIAKMWDGQVEGSSAMVQDIVLKETKTIFSNLQSYNETDILAALQALMIYTILLIVPSTNKHAIPFLDSSVLIGLQQVVYYTAATDLVLQEESDHTVPSWEAWAHVASKRRVIVCLYILHWAYAVYHGLPSFNCDELGFLPAPAAKFLWQASTKHQWEVLYERWLMQWAGREYLQKEFHDTMPDVILDQRTQMWLEDADELGILFLSICELYIGTPRTPRLLN